jgi:hypothetical protein
MDMISRLKIVSLAAATLLIGASQAWAQPEGTPAYRTDFYNNAAHDTLVGSISPIGCDDDEVYYRLIGTQTSYSDQELVGYCSEGVYNPV